MSDCALAAPVVGPSFEQTQLEFDVFINADCCNEGGIVK